MAFDSWKWISLLKWLSSYGICIINRIVNLHKEQKTRNIIKTTKFIVYRGQELCGDTFKIMREQKGGLMCFNNFLSTSENRDISLNSFARPAANDLSKPNHVGILFEMVIDPKICEQSNTPFVTITEGDGSFKGTEGEILISTHTIFHINRINAL